MAPFEVIPVSTLEVACDGGSVALGHPRVFLHIDKDEGQTTCPYCSRQFVFTPSDHGHGSEFSHHSSHEHR
jgi:uncharacterized Zn-finger protein